MQTKPSKLNDQHDRLVLDASVAINILGTGEAAAVLRALERRIVIDEYAVGEILVDPFTKGSGADSIGELAAAGIVSPVRLGDEAYEIFLELTGTPPPDDLGDGEAATIATAITTGAVPVIDERKARRVFARLSTGPVLHTVDLLASRCIENAFGSPRVAAIVFNALRCARMRVPYDCDVWVRELLGPDRVRECASLTRVFLS